ncbi:uncharacterized protein ACIQIH_000613 isoform 3-T3 [Cyanocitta cristata]
MSCVALVLEWERPLGALAGAAPKGNRGNPGGGGGKRCRSLGGIPGKRKAAEAARTELEAGSSRQRTSRTATSPSRTAGMSCVALVLEWERPLGALAGAAPKGNRGNPGGGGGKRCRSLGGIPGKRKAAEAARTELEAGSSRQRTSRTATSPSRTAGMSCVALVLEWERPLGALAGAAPKGNRGNPGGGGGKRCRSLGGIPGKRKAAEAARTELEAGSSRQRTPRTATSPSRTAGMSCVALVLEWERPLGALAGAAPKGNRGNPGGGGGKRCRSLGGIPGKRKAAEAARTELEAGSSREWYKKYPKSRNPMGFTCSLETTIQWEV